MKWTQSKAPFRSLRLLGIFYQEAGFKLHSLGDYSPTYPYPGFQYYPVSVLAKTCVPHKIENINDTGRTELYV